MAETLSTEEIEAALPDAWHLAEGEIARTYEFDDYLDGVAFAADVGDLAEEAFHHPTIVVRYKEVEVRFTSHEAGGVTEQDIGMAERTDDLF